jgi:CHAT domain-containing protein/tetratricopeptide (TPR) repeat protein
MINWRTGPEGIDGFLFRLGYPGLLATDTSDPAAVDPRVIADLLARSERTAHDGDLVTAGWLAARAAHLSAVWDLPLPAGQAVLLLAQVAVAGQQAAAAVVDALVLVSGIVATLVREGGDIAISPMVSTLAEVAARVTLVGTHGARIRASLVPVKRFFDDRGDVVALAWTELVLAQAATEGGDVAAGEDYLRLMLEARAMLATPALAAAPPGQLAAPQAEFVVAVMVVVAMAFLGDKDEERAEFWAEEATKLDAESWQAWSTLATVYQESSQFEAALRSLDTAIALRPDDPAGYAAAASILGSLGRVPEAVERATAAIEHGSDPSFFLLRGQLHYEAGDNAAALEDLDQVSKIASGDLTLAGQVVVLTARSLLAMGDARAALDAVTALEGTQPPGSPVTALYAMLAAEILASIGQLAEAIEQCTRWIEVTPEDADAWLGRADARLKIGDEAGARADLREAARISRDPESALLRIEPLVTDRPDDPSLLALRGFALSEAGHRDRAMTDLDRAAALAPDNYEIRMTRGLARLRCNFDLEDWSDEPLEIETVMASVEDLAASAYALGDEARSAYVWLADRITAHDDICDRMLQPEVPGAIAAVLPAAGEPLRAWLDARALAKQRRWPETIERLTAAQQGLAGLGLVCFASRIDLDVADCHIRLGEFEQSRLLLDRWDVALALHNTPWTPSLNIDLDKIRRSALESTGRYPATFEVEYLRLYGVILDVMYYQQLLDALVTSRLGDPQGALRKLGPPDKVSQLTESAENAWFDVASILRDSGRTEQALVIVEDALADPAFRPGDRLRAENLRGSLLLVLSRPRDAERAFRRSAKAARRLGDSYAAVVTHCNLASALVERGEPEHALAELESVREDIRRAPGVVAQHPWQIVEARALAALGRLDEAEAAVLEAVRLSETTLASLRTADLQTAWQGGRQGLYDLAVDIALRAGHSRKALELVEMARSRAFLFQLTSRVPEAVAGPDSADPSGETDDKLVAPALVNRRRVLARLLAAARQGGRVDPEVHSELQQVQVKVEDVTETVDLRPQATAATALPAAESRLSVDKLLRLLRDTAAGLDQAQRLQSTAVKDPGDSIGVAPLTVEALQALLRDDPSIQAPVTLVEMFMMSHALYLFGLGSDWPEPQGVALDIASTEALLARLTTTVASWVQPGTRLCLVMHGELNRFPFHAVEVGGQALGIRNPVFYAPSASILQVCRNRRSPRRRSGVVLADARVGTPAPILRAQALAIGSKLDERRVLLGADANRANLLAALGDLDAGLVHLGIHGRFETDDPTLSAIGLADGWLTAEELAGLDLHVDLVTLAACNSGETGLIGDDEILGLTRSLLYAGVASVLVADQAVEEFPTALLLEYFYDHLLVSGEAKVDALRAAQDELCTTTVTKALAYLETNSAAVTDDPVGDAHLLLTQAELYAEAWAFEEANRRFAALQQRIADAPLAFPATLAQKVEAGRARVQLMARTGHGADYERTPFADPSYWAPFALIGDWH